jgi:ornithine carbamoyltransferase
VRGGKRHYLVNVMRHFLDLLDLNADDLNHLLADATAMKKDHKRGKRKAHLAGRVLGLVFEKPSLRTRVSFEAAMAQLGGSSIFLSSNDGQLGKRESVPDFARTLSQYVDVAALRTFSHRTVEEFAQYATVPVINALSDASHPCQILGDLLTMQELFGNKLHGRTLVFVGDGNNVARSMAVGCAMLGVRFILAAPDGYRFDDEFVQALQKRHPQGEVIQNGVPTHAVGSADVIYTDVWTSMGQEAEHEERLQKFAPFQVNSQLLALAPAHTRLMHCLPARRGEEVTAEAMESDRSIIFEQAGNRMHAQKALLKWLLA